MNQSNQPVFVASNQVKGMGEEIDFYNPYSWYETMRKEAPVYYNEEIKAWYVFLYDDVKRVMGDQEFFSSNFPEPSGIELSNNLLRMDPPKHTNLRSVVSRAFTPKVMKEWEPRIREITSDLLDRLEGREKIDIVKDFAKHLPVIVITELVGVPSEHIDKFREWSEIVVTSPKSNSKEDQEQFLAKMINLSKELESFFAEIIENKRGDLGQDLISVLIQAEEEGIKITPEDLVPFCTLLLIAGNETSTSLISNSLYSVIEHEGVYDELKNDLSLVPQMIEETLRFRSPAQSARRIVTKDTELGGHRIVKGESVIAWIGSANRDEGIFADASKYDIHRIPNPHVAFGQGIHFCLGAPLARLEANIAITEFIKRYSSISLSEESPIETAETIFFNGLKGLPVNVTL